jgi:hypothetical protein
LATVSCFPTASHVKTDDAAASRQEPIRSTHRSLSRIRSFSLPPLWEPTEAAERARIKADGGSTSAKRSGGECRLTLAAPILTFPHQGGRNQFGQLQF